MPTLKIQTWRPDTHSDHVVEIEWEYDREAGRDTGREHRGVSIRYPDGTCIHRDTHGAEATNEHYKKLLAEHVIKNHAYKLIIDFLPARMDSDGDPVLDNAGLPRLMIKDKHRPRWKHLGNGHYEFTVPAIDEATHRDLAAILSTQFGDKIVLLKSGS